MIIFALEVNLMLGIIGIKVCLGSFVKALKQPLVVQVLPFLIIEITLLLVVLIL